MGRIIQVISIRTDQKEKIDKLIGKRQLSKICQDAIDRYLEIPQGKEQLEQAISEEELKIEQSATRRTFLQGKLELINASQAYQLQKERKDEEQRQASELIRKAHAEEMQKLREAEQERVRQEQVAFDSKITGVLEIIEKTTDFPSRFAKRVAAAFLKVQEPNGTKLLDVLLKTAQANGYCFDKDKFLALDIPKAQEKIKIFKTSGEKIAETNEVK